MAAKWEKERQKVERDKKRMEDLLAKGSSDLDFASILRILGRSPGVGNLNSLNELLPKWAPVLLPVFANNGESRYLGRHPLSDKEEIPFWIGGQDPTGYPKIVFTSQTGDVPRRNGLTRWNSMDVNYCDLNDPVFLEFFSQLGPVGNLLHEIRIGAQPRGPFYRGDHWFSDPWGEEVPEITQETMSRCLAALLRSGCTQNLRVLHIVKDQRFQSSLDWGTMAAAMKDNRENIPQLRTIEMECENMGSAPPEEVKAWVDYLQYQNKTLVRLPGTTIGKDETIQNYLYLNRMGRAQAANCEGGDELVQLLCPGRTLDRKKRSNLNRCNLIYGLLREAPGLWAKHCAGTSSAKPKGNKKRKKSSSAAATRSQPKRQGRSKSTKH